MVGDRGNAATGRAETAGSSAVPSAWLELRAALAHLMDNPPEQPAARHGRDALQEALEAQRQRLSAQAPNLTLPDGLSSDVLQAVRDTIDFLREQHGRLLDDLAVTVADFDHAAENEDRLVLLVFGEVNAGKSSLANHLAGLDFTLPDEVTAGECFSSSGAVARLEEAPTECTRTYQGFRLPGLLWIDCPGVLSQTGANAELAQRLVARADFLLFLSSSDAPFKESEMNLLRQLIETTDSEGLQGCVLVTKADVCEEDEDPETGELVWQIRPKGQEARTAQALWCREQLDRSGLGSLVRLGEPLAVSVYLARECLGRAWDSGAPLRPVAADWEDAYEQSGMPGLCRLLTDLVREQGQELKAQWPRKRTRALQRKLCQAAEEALGRLTQLAAAVRQQQRHLQEAEQEAALTAATQAAGRVGPCLTRHGLYRPGRFARREAGQELQEVLRHSIEEALTRTAGAVLEPAGRRVTTALADFLAGIDFDLDVRRRVRRRTQRGRDWAHSLGGGGGGLAGATAGGMFGMLVLGPLGSLVGSVAGGLLGSLGGVEIGKGVFRGPIKVEIAAGTNADEVIARTRACVQQRTQEAVAAVFQTLEQSVFAPLLAEIERLQAEVEQWPHLLDRDHPLGR